MKNFTFLCVILALYASERVGADSHPFQKVTLTGKLNNLKEAVQSMRVLYPNSTVEDNINALLQETTQVDERYLFAQGPLVQWCESVKNGLLHTVKVIQKPNLPDVARSDISNRTKDLLLRGVRACQYSMNHTEQAVKHMSTSIALLKVIEMQINEEISSNGHSGIRSSWLRNGMDRTKMTSGLIHNVLVESHLLSTVILSFVAGPVGIAMGLSSNLAAAGIPVAVVYGHTIPTLKQQVTIVDEFFKMLQDTLRRAKEECIKMDEALKTQLRDINQVAAAIEITKPDDVMFSEFSEVFVDSLNKLSDSCKGYVESHSSTPSRRRRAAVAKKVPTTPENNIIV